MEVSRGAGAEAPASTHFSTHYALPSYALVQILDTPIRSAIIALTTSSVSADLISGYCLLRLGVGGR